MTALLGYTIATIILIEVIRVYRWAKKTEEIDDAFTTTVGGKVHFCEHNLYDKGDQ